MKAKAWRLYGAGDAWPRDIELEGAGEEGIVVELVTNTICLSDYKGFSLGTGHKRVPRDIATRPTMFGHEVSGIGSAFRTNYHNAFCLHDFHVGIAKKDKTDPFYAELARLCAANNGLWSKAAEDNLLAHAPKIETGTPKELVKERIIGLSV